MPGLQRESAVLGRYQQAVDASLRALGEKRIVRRIWEHDYSVWDPEPTEISNRLDWLHSPRIMLDQLNLMDELVRKASSGGYTRVLLLGMGGSSLAPAVFSHVFGKIAGHPELTVLDSTDPDTVASIEKALDLRQTLFVVSSKSGGTVETLSLMKYFFARAGEALGEGEAARHFIGITDPGSGLASIAEKNGFLERILNDPNIGGRYSALSYDGLVPAALMGVDVGRLLREARAGATACEQGAEPGDNPGAWLGAILGSLANAGRDKATFVVSPRVGYFANWVEQLIAESTGKGGKGILPVVGERLGPPGAYGGDRLFVALEMQGDPVDESRLSELQGAGHPVVHLRFKDPYELGRQFFVWEMAIAVAGHIIGINPFDQPNVESAKALGRRMVGDYKKSGALPRLSPALTSEGITVYGEVAGESPPLVLDNFLSAAKPGAYIAIQAYIQQTDAADDAFLELRERLMERFKLATTLGYGPRFLHSTGQLHKGDAGRGLFLQITSDDSSDLPVPDELGSPNSSVTFGVMKEAEALGDRQALLDAGREVIRFHIKGDVPKALNRLVEGLPAATKRASRERR